MFTHYHKILSLKKSLGKENEISLSTRRNLSLKNKLRANSSAAENFIHCYFAHLNCEDLYKKRSLHYFTDVKIAASSILIILLKI